VPSVSLEGTNIWYEIGGEGPNLLQIGGAGFAHDNFANVVDDFRQHYSVIDFDLRGYGNSDRPDQDYSMETWADDIADMLGQIGITRTHVHGTSMGGMVAIKLAAKYPDLIDKLVIGCAAAKCDRTARIHFELWKFIARNAGMDSEELATEISTKALTRQFLDTDQGKASIEHVRGMLGRNCSVNVFSSACDAMIEMDLRPDLPNISAPTLVMDGDVDVLTPLDMGPDGAGNRYIAEQIPNSELYIFKDCGHTNLLEYPEESIDVIRRFLDA